MRSESGHGQRRGEAGHPAETQDDLATGSAAHSDHIAIVWRLLRAMEVSPDNAPQACVSVFQRAASNDVAPDEAAFGIPIERVVDPLLAAAFRAARSQWQSLPRDEEAGSSGVRNQGELLVLGLLGGLDEPKRVILLLADMEQLSSPEIAALMGLRLDVVYEELRKARKTIVRMRKRLEHTGATGDAEAEARELLAQARTWFSPDSAALLTVSEQLGPLA